MIGVYKVLKTPYFMFKDENDLFVYSNTMKTHVFLSNEFLDGFNLCDISMTHMSNYVEFIDKGEAIKISSIQCISDIPTLIDKIPEYFI